MDRVVWNKRFDLILLKPDKLWCESTTNPVPVLRIAASRGYSELTQNWIISSHGHFAPSLKISCKSVQPFSRNLANKETKKQRNKETKKDAYKQRNRSKTIPRSPMYRRRGNKALDKNSSLSYGASPAIWDHTVLPVTRHKWTRPALTPASKLVLDLPTPEGWKAELT